MNRAIITIAAILLTALLFAGLGNRRTDEENAEPERATKSADLRQETESPETVAVSPKKFEKVATVKPRFQGIAENSADRLAVVELFSPENAAASSQTAPQPTRTGAVPARLEHFEVTPLPQDPIAEPRHAVAQARDGSRQPDWQPQAEQPLLPGETNVGAENGDLVVHAGGAIELPVDEDWQVREIPIGREIRVLLVPSHATEEMIKQGNLPAGIWITHHVNRSGSLTPAVLLSERRGEFGEAQETLMSTEVDLAGKPARLEDFVQGTSRRIMIAVQATWGICEIQAWSPRNEFDANWASWEPILNKLKIGQPQTPQHLSTRAPLGLWKSHHGYIHLLEDGRLKLAEDEAVSLGFEKLRRKRVKPAAPLMGNYEVAEDVLRIEWHDGSQLNLRWQVVDDQLRITDHLGRISRLRRVYH